MPCHPMPFQLARTHHTPPPYISHPTSLSLSLSFSLFSVPSPRPRASGPNASIYSFGTPHEKLIVPGDLTFLSVQRGSHSIPPHYIMQIDTISSCINLIYLHDTLTMCRTIPPFSFNLSLTNLISALIDSLADSPAFFYPLGFLLSNFHPFFVSFYPGYIVFHFMHLAISDRRHART